MSTNGLNLASFAGLGRNASNNNTDNKQEEAEFWLNIGYQTTVVNDGNEEEIFVSLARGIPLDQIKPFDVSKARTTNMAALRDAQNQLHASFMSVATQLEPGASAIIITDETIGLAVQIKRVRGAMETPQENTLAKAIPFRPIAA
jgi:hypothetical protein